MNADSTCDLLVVGGGPAGSAAAITAAHSGLRVLLLDRAVFPRAKVCGDCLNPSAWAVLERLGVADEVQALPHARLETLRLVDLNGRRTELPLPDGPRGEIAVPRMLLDHLLIEQAGAAGAVVQTGEAVLQVRQENGWRVVTDRGEYHSPRLIAADGRNSTVCRSLGLMPEAARNRLALQAQGPLSGDLQRTVALELRSGGYCGVADVGGGEIDVCLVGTASSIKPLREWAQTRFGISPEQNWQSIAPLARSPIRPMLPNLLLAGDAARVVEPFTGEGIYYALASGELAGHAMVEAHASGRPLDTAKFWKRHGQLYRGRLWVNQLARFSVSNPRLGHSILFLARLLPGTLPWLSRRIIQALPEA